MASSKARPRNRPAPGKSGRSAAGKGPNASRTGGGASPAPARPAQVASQTAAASQTTVSASQPTAQVNRTKRQPVEVTPEPVRPAGPPLWVQIVTQVLALGGLGVSIYETWAHFNGSRLFACNGNGSENCTAVITSPQSMVFGVVPVAILGLIFYVFVVAIMSPWAWRIQRREVGLLRLAAMVAGMGFVVYLIYAELYEISSWCLYCTGVHIITFLLFCITVVSAALWGIGKPKPAA